MIQYCMMRLEYLPYRRSRAKALNAVIMEQARRKLESTPPAPELPPYVCNLFFVRINVVDDE